MFIAKPTVDFNMFDMLKIFDGILVCVVTRFVSFYSCATDVEIASPPRAIAPAPLHQGFFLHPSHAK